MKETKVKAQVGEIYEVTTEIFYPEYRTQHQGKPERDLSCHVKKGERLEIRYPFEWNFRLEDNLYLNCPEDYLFTHCKLVGHVKDEVRRNNKANLEEILRLGLWDELKL